MVDIERTIQAAIEKQEWDLIQRLDSHHRRLYEALIDSYKDVDEYHYVANDTKCIVTPQSQNEFRCTDVVAYCGPGPGLLTLGDRQIYLPQGLSSFAGKFRLKNTDTRRLDSISLTGSGNPLFGSGTITNPGANASIIALTIPVAGKYDITVRLNAGATAPTINNNVKFIQAGNLNALYNGLTMQLTANGQITEYTFKSAPLNAGQIFLQAMSADTGVYVGSIEASLISYDSQINGTGASGSLFLELMGQEIPIGSISW